MNKPDRNQSRVIDVFMNTNYNILLGAVAGSGKTTTIMMLIDRLPARSMYVAFNKSIQQEMEEKFKKRNMKKAKAMTMHSLGLSSIRKHYKPRIVSAGVSYKLSMAFQEKHEKKMKNYGVSFNDKVQLGYTLRSFFDLARMFLTTDLDELHDKYMDTSSFPLNNNMAKLLTIFWKDFVEIMEERYAADTLEEIDFLDMIYVPVIKNMEIPWYPKYVFIDECQDLNYCQHKLLENLCNNEGVEKWVAVGDEKQSIYGFSGAINGSFDLFRERPNVMELPLDVCYRCPMKVVDFANQVFSNMQYGNAEKGIVSKIKNPKTIKDKGLVICRNTSPLIDLYFRLIAVGKQCKLLGDEILKPLLNFLTPYKKKYLFEVVDMLKERVEELRLYSDDKDSYFEFLTLDEHYNNFKSLATHFKHKCETVEDMISHISELYKNEDENAITLCTIHKSKGMEADNVYILNEFLIPSKFAKTDAQLAQEKNLKYVARSRAKEGTYLINIEKQKYEQ